MKRLTAAALSAILLVGCGSGKTVSADERSAAAPMPKAADLSSSRRSADPSSAESRIIYRERLYNTDSSTKSNLIVQSDGTVWCGFYSKEEGTIDRFNRLWTSETDYENFFELDDDRWLKAILTETKDDDFLLFKDTEGFEALSGESLEKLNSLVESSDPFSACNVKTASEAEAAPAVLETEYSFVDLICSGEIYRVYEYTQSTEKIVQDDSASEAVELVHSCAFYNEWKELCREKLV